MEFVYAGGGGILSPGLVFSVGWWWLGLLLLYRRGCWQHCFHLRSHHPARSGLWSSASGHTRSSWRPELRGMVFALIWSSTESMDTLRSARSSVHKGMGKGEVMCGLHFPEFAVVAQPAGRERVGVVVKIEIFTTLKADISASSRFFATFVWHR